MTRTEPETSAAIPAPGAPATKLSWRYWAVLCAILAIGAGLRVYHIGHESLWVDEIYMLEYSAGHCHAEFALPQNRVMEHPPRLTSLANAAPVWKIPVTLREDQHPPLYYVLLRLWRGAFGSSEAGLRSLSVVVSLVSIVLLFDVGRRLFSPGAALWACALMAVAQAEIRYAQEARSYALLTTAVLAAAAALVRIERRGFSARRAVALGASMLAIVLTHYYGIAGCAALGAYAVIRLRGTTRVRTFGAMVAAAVVFAAAWGPFFLQQMHGYGVGSDWLAVDAKDLNSPLLSWARRLLYAPIRFFAEPSFRNPGALPMIVASVLVLPWLRIRRVPGLLLPALWILAWFGLVGGLDLARATRQMDFTRYLLGAAPAVYLVVAALLWDHRGWIRHVVPAAFVLYCAISLPWTYDSPKAEWRRLGADLAREARPDDLVLYYAATPADWYVGMLYLATDHYAPHVRNPAVVVTAPLPADVRARLRSARAVWMASDVADPDLPRLVPGFHVARSWLSWGAGYLLRLEPDGPRSATAPSSPAPPAAGTGTSSTPTTRGT